MRNQLDYANTTWILVRVGIILLLQSNINHAGVLCLMGTPGLQYPKSYPSWRIEIAATDAENKHCHSGIARTRLVSVHYPPKCGLGLLLLVLKINPELHSGIPVRWLNQNFRENKQLTVYRYLPALSEDANLFTLMFIFLGVSVP